MSTPSMIPEARRVITMTPGQLQLQREVAALAAISDHFAELDQAACDRVISWARARFVDHRPDPQEDVR